MKNNASTIAFWAVFVLSLTAILFTAEWWIMGGLIGYGVGYINAEVLMFYTRQSMDMDIKAAVRKMRLSFINRLGLVTLVVIIVAKYQKGWLPALAVGLATGLFLSLILKYRQFIQLSKSGKG